MQRNIRSFHSRFVRYVTAAAITTGGFLMPVLPFWVWALIGFFALALGAGAIRINTVFRKQREEEAKYNAEIERSRREATIEARIRDQLDRLEKKLGSELYEEVSSCLLGTSDAFFYTMRQYSPHEDLLLRQLMNLAGFMHPGASTKPIATALRHFLQCASTAHGKLDWLLIAEVLRGEIEKELLSITQSVMRHISTDPV